MDKKNVSAAVAEEEVTSVKEQEQEVIEEEEIDVGVVLPCKMTKSKGQDGKIYHNFFVEITVFGKVMRLELRPKDGDRDAYAKLDIIFDAMGGAPAPLHCVENTMTGEDGKKTRYMSYEVSVRDEATGITVCCPLVPFQASNKKMLEQVYRAEIAKKSGQK